MIRSIAVHSQDTSAICIDRNHPIFSSGDDGVFRISSRMIFPAFCVNKCIALIDRDGKRPTQTDSIANDSLTTTAAPSAEYKSSVDVDDRQTGG